MRFANKESVLNLANFSEHSAINQVELTHLSIYMQTVHAESTYTEAGLKLFLRNEIRFENDKHCTTV